MGGGGWGRDNPAGPPPLKELRFTRAFVIGRNHEDALALVKGGWSRSASRSQGDHNNG